ncbi:unnamed protein product [Tetraodon nigroviridis]|uniref:(spotted green pufferfish) hypothetical protein n=1 Tax=Tetraodon nigroviridis TaxID=99883 RepID=Q4REE8_TETNG|nr:unnamed protein product [Tetraodon nigroviridis]
MKKQEAELVGEISKLHCLVSELKRGFSSALLELSHIQHGDAHLREELEENRRSCRKKAARLELLVASLRVSGAPAPADAASRGNAQVCSWSCRRSLEPCRRSSPSCTFRGRVLLRRARETGDQRDRPFQPCTPLTHVLTCPPVVQQRCGRSPLRPRTCAAVQREGAAPLFPAGPQSRAERRHRRVGPLRTQSQERRSRTLVELVGRLLQRHLLFRNSLQERLSAGRWRSLVGDVLVQLIGQNDRDQEDGEEMKLLSLLLSPVARIHAYLNHIQSLLQWTGEEHPDCSLLLGAEGALRDVLSRCHSILDEDGRREAGGGSGRSCCEAAGSCGSSRRRKQQDGEELQKAAGPLLVLQPRQAEGCGGGWGVQNLPGRDCGHARCSLLTPDAAEWGENSDSGQGTFSQHTGRGTIGPEAGGAACSLQDPETDRDDTSALGDSSVTSCSPDGTLRPPLQRRRPARKEAGQHQDRLASAPPQERLPAHLGRPVRAGDPPPQGFLRSLSSSLVCNAVPSLQDDSAPERDVRKGFVPVQAAARQHQNPGRDNLRLGAKLTGGMKRESSSSVQNKTG